MKIDYSPKTCECCRQSIEYLLPLDRGSVDILKAVARAVGEKGINAIHPRKEIEGKYLSSNQVGNLSRPRFHGLIAKIKGNKGNYCLTDKGLCFLRGERYIPKFAIINKKIGNVGYYEQDKYAVHIKDFMGEEYWEGINYKIEEGKIIQ